MKVQNRARHDVLELKRIRHHRRFVPKKVYCKHLRFLGRAAGRTGKTPIPHLKFQLTNSLTHQTSTRGTFRQPPSSNSSTTTKTSIAPPKHIPMKATVVLLVLTFVLSRGNAFSIVSNNQHVATPTALEAFKRSTSPSSTSVSFLRSGRQSNHRKRQGQTEASAEGDPPSPNGINHKGEEPDAKNTNKPKKRGYVPIEEWNEAQKAGGMDWEQKVQFDGLRMGNGVRQNEILQRHLNSF